MAQDIILKRSSVEGKVPLLTDLKLGELAVNTFDGKIFLKKDDGAETIVDITGTVEPAGALNAVQLNAGDGTLNAVALGTSEHVLTSNGAAAPTWQPISTPSSVTSVGLDGGT